MNSSWNKDWLEAQKKYMEALASFGTASSENQSSARQGNEWQKALDYWWQSSSTDLPENAQAVFSNLLQHSKSWYATTELWDGLLKTVTKNSDADLDWESELAKYIENMKAQLKEEFSNADSHVWQLGLQSPLDAWQKMFNEIFSGIDLPNQLPLDELQGFFENIYSTSSLGANRQAYDKMQEGMLLWQTYQKHYQKYRETLNRIAVKSLDKLEKKVVLLAKKQESISSLRDLYDLWIDSHEEAYAEFVLTEEYSLLYGQLINSMLAFKAHSQQMFSDSSEALDLATTDQQNALQQELLNLKVEQEQDKKRIQALEEKISQMSSASTNLNNEASISRKKKTEKKKVNKKNATGKKPVRQSSKKKSKASSAKERK